MALGVYGAHPVEVSTAGLHEEFCFPSERHKVALRGVIHVIVGDFRARLKAEKLAFQNLPELIIHCITDAIEHHTQNW